MKHFLIAFFLLMTSMVFGQKDTTLTIRVSSIREFPQIGLDLKGRKYFVMSTRQDKAAITSLMQGLYADSILTKYDELRESCDSTIALLQGRVIDRGKTIDAQVITIRQLEENYRDMRAQIENKDKNIADLNQHIKQQKLPMWGGTILGVIGGIIILDKITQ
jgi:hypothetical protein